MTITYPRSLAQLTKLLPIKEVVWRPQRAEEYQLQGSAETISFELAPMLWAADITLDKDRWTEARKVAARINALRGSFGTFYLTNPIARFPFADPTGAGLAGFTPKVYAIHADRIAVRIGGLPVGYTVTEGDYFHVDFSADPVRRGFFQLLETGVAGGDGRTGYLEVTPNVWTGITAGLDAVLVESAAKVFVQPNTLTWGAIRKAMVDGASFTVLQKL